MAFICIDSISMDGYPEPEVLKKVWINELFVNYIQRPKRTHRGQTTLRLSDSAKSSSTGAWISTNKSIELVAEEFNLAPAKFHDFHGHDKNDGEIIYINPHLIRTFRQRTEGFWVVEFQDGFEIHVKEQPFK